MNRNTTPGDLPPLLSSLRHQWRAVLLSVLVISGLANLWVLQTPLRYTAEAAILLSPVPGNPLAPASATAGAAQLEVAMQTEAGIVRSPGIEETVTQQLGRPAPGNGEQLLVGVPPGTQLIEIAFTSRSAVDASNGAQAYAEQYLDFRQDRAVATQELQLDRFRNQAQTADENLRRASAEASDETAGYASQEVQLYADRLSQINESISTNEVVSTDPGRIITPAEPPAVADGVPGIFVVMAGPLVGLLVGMVLALMLEWRRGLVRERGDLEVAGVPVFAHLPGRRASGLGTGDGDGEALREAFRRLRAGVIANAPRPHVLAVAGVEVHEHTGNVTANLAMALAQARFSVLVIACDPRDRSVERLYHVEEGPGLTDVLEGRTRIDECLVRTHNLTILTSGADSDEVREMYAGPEFRRVIDEVRGDYDYVLLDAAGAGTADGDAVLSASDSTLLVLAMSRTTQGQVRTAVHRFDRLGVTVAGSVAAPSTAGRRHGPREGSWGPGGQVSASGTHDVDALA